MNKLWISQIANNEDYKIKKILNPLTKKYLYIMYLYKPERLESIKKEIYKKHYIIKIYYEDNYIKLMYKRGYNPHFPLYLYTYNKNKAWQYFEKN